MDKLLIVFTMKGCPFCDMMKEQLVEENIEYYERDIDEHDEEHKLFVEVTGNEYVPAFMLIESPETEPVTELFAPDRDFDDINEGFEIIKSQSTNIHGFILFSTFIISFKTDLIYINMSNSI